MSKLIPGATLLIACSFLLEDLQHGEAIVGGPGKTKLGKFICDGDVLACTWSPTAVADWLSCAGAGGRE